MIILALLLAQAAGMDKVRVCDKANAAQCAAVNSSGQVSIAGTISASTTGRATAGVPSYTEGTDNPLSIDLSGNIRTLSTAQTAAKATAADPSYVEGTTDPISQDLAGYLRVRGTFWPTAAGFPSSFRLSDGAAFYDARSIRLLTSSDIVDLSDRSGRALGSITNTSFNVGNFPASQAVTGTFWQATQPVSGTFWQATQPVSGTFWQATQPVSGTVTANQGGTWTVQPGNTANTTAWKVDGSAVTQPISAVSLPLPLAAASDATVAETHAVSLGSIPTRQDMIAGSDYGTTCNGGACSQIPRVDANGNQYVGVANIVRIQVSQPMNALLQRCNAVRRTNCQP